MDNVAQIAPWAIPGRTFLWRFLAKPCTACITLTAALLVQTQKPHKIDLNGEYPCPCRRRGKLTPIALTDAFGCNRCQQIFVVQDSGHTIEQLSTNYPYKRVWRWNGHQWIVVNPALGKGYVPLTLLLMFALVFLLLLTTLSAPAGSQVAFRVVAALVLSVMLAFMLWLACRR